MPELPEVETIVSGLIPQIQGATILSVTVLNDSSIEGSRFAFDTYVAGRSISRIHRRGKLLLIDLGENFPGKLAEPDKEASSSKQLDDLTSRMKYADEYPMHLGIHLKMSGRLFVYDAGTPAETHTRVIFDLDNGKRLFFNDVRKFGYCRPVSANDWENWSFLKTLGPEPLEIDSVSFAALFKGRKIRIKAALLDQKIIAGIGNIYADESLFRAGIRPDAICGSLSALRLRKLHGDLQAVLLQSIKECGSSIKDYRDAHGDAGAFQNNFAVYGRSGCLCTTCKSPLTTAKIAGRTTVFCETCQTD